MSDVKLFADGVMEANVMNGVVRITLGQAGGDGKPVACGQILVPLVQLPALTNGLVNLVRQIETKVKEATDKSKADGAAAPSAETPPVPSTFSFQKGTA
ncbi:MAG: hypothetical protein IT556_01285 [Acetobacteraceae bacterium]|nr:hypothetical protein [Acetobacteraceae bacterium]